MYIYIYLPFLVNIYVFFLNTYLHPSWIILFEVGCLFLCWFCICHFDINSHSITMPLLILLDPSKNEKLLYVTFEDRRKTAETIVTQEAVKFVQTQ